MTTARTEGAEQTTRTPLTISDDEMLVEIARLFEDCLGRLYGALVEGQANYSRVDNGDPDPAAGRELEDALRFATKLKILIDQFLSGTATARGVDEIALLGWTVGLNNVSRELALDSVGALLPDASIQTAAHSRAAA